MYELLLLHERKYTNKLNRLSRRIKMNQGERKENKSKSPETERKFMKEHESGREFRSLVYRAGFHYYCATPAF